MNEAEGLRQLLPKVVNDDCTVFVCDRGSTDESVKVATSLGALVCHGSGSVEDAIHRGMSLAAKGLIIIMEVVVERYDHNEFLLDLQYLTKSERRVLYWLIRGYNNDAIGVILNVESNTVERHINGIYEKTRLRTSITWGETPRAAICWLCLRDGIYSFLSEEGDLSTLEDNLRGFNPKERLIVDLLKLGHTNKNIADILHVSESMVSWHVRGISFKVGLNGQFGRDTVGKRRELVERLSTI